MNLQAGSSAAWIRPDWPVADRVAALVTTRSGGVSVPPFDSMNLGDHVGDDAVAVAENRRLLEGCLPADQPVQWLTQVHGTAVFEPGVARDSDDEEAPEADAALIRRPGRVLAVLTADCLPVLIADRDGRAVGVAHAGWRGLLDGILERLVLQMPVPPQSLMAWLGPAIGPCHFEVGEEVRSAFLQAAGDDGGQVRQLFRDHGPPGKCMADLYGLARIRLHKAGLSDVYGGQFCTCCDAERFYSYRRDGVTGRMASLIWLNN